MSDDGIQSNYSRKTKTKVSKSKNRKSMSQRISMTQSKKIEKEDFNIVINRTKKEPDFNYEKD